MQRGKKQAEKVLSGTTSVGRKSQHKGLVVNSPYIQPIIIPQINQNQDNSIYLTTRQLIEAAAFAKNSNVTCLNKSFRTPSSLETPPVSVAQYQHRKKILQDDIDMVQGLSLLRNISQNAASENWHLVLRNRAFLSSVIGSDWNAQLRLPKPSREQSGKTSRESIRKYSRDMTASNSEHSTQGHDKNLRSNFSKRNVSSQHKVKFGNAISTNHDSISHSTQLLTKSSGNMNRTLSKSSKNSISSTKSNGYISSSRKSQQQVKPGVAKAPANSKVAASNKNVPVAKSSILSMTFGLLSGEEREPIGSADTPVEPIASTPSEESRLSSTSSSVTCMVNQNSDSNCKLRGRPGPGTNRSTVQKDTQPSNKNCTDHRSKDNIVVPCYKNESGLSSSGLPSEETLQPKNPSERTAKKLLSEQSRKIQTILGWNKNVQLRLENNLPLDQDSEKALKQSDTDTSKNSISKCRKDNAYLWDIPNMRLVDILSPCTGSTVNDKTNLSSGVSSGSCLASEQPDNISTESISFLVKSLKDVDIKSSNNGLVGISTDSFCHSDSSLKLEHKSPTFLVYGQFDSGETDLSFNFKASKQLDTGFPKKLKVKISDDSKNDKNRINNNEDAAMSPSSTSICLRKNKKADDGNSGSALTFTESDTGTSQCQANDPRPSLVAINIGIADKEFVFDDDNYFNYSTGTTPICRSQLFKFSGQQLNFGDISKSTLNRNSVDNLIPKSRRRKTENALRKQGKVIPVPDEDFEGPFYSENQDLVSYSLQKPRKKAGRRVSFSDPIALWKAIPDQTFGESTDLFFDVDETLRRHIYFRYPHKPEIIEY